MLRIFLEKKQIEISHYFIFYTYPYYFLFILLIIFFYIQKDSSYFKSSIRIAMLRKENIYFLRARLFSLFLEATQTYQIDNTWKEKSRFQVRLDVIKIVFPPSASIVHGETRSFGAFVRQLSFIYFNTPTLHRSRVRAIVGPRRD